MDLENMVDLEEDDMEVFVSKSYSQLLEQICQDDFFECAKRVPQEYDPEDLCIADAWLSNINETIRDFEAELQTAADSVTSMENCKVLMDQIGGSIQMDGIFSGPPPAATTVVLPRLAHQNSGETDQLRALHRDSYHLKTTGALSVTYIKEGAVICRDWLLEHYELVTGVSVPRSAMYNHYLDHCQELGVSPLNPAGFGKAIRATFPTIKTRRLGNRGASKYHYDGISIKKTSPYCSQLSRAQRVSQPMFHSKFLPNGLALLAEASVSETTSQATASPSPDAVAADDSSPPPASAQRVVPAISNKCRTIVMGEPDKEADRPRDLRSELPSLDSMVVPPEYLGEVAEFLGSYAGHLLDLQSAITPFNYYSVKDKLSLYWSSFTCEAMRVLGSDIFLHMVHYCDIIFHRQIAASLMPDLFAKKTNVYLVSVRHFGKQYVAWMFAATSHLPAGLRQVKVTEAQDLYAVLQRLTTINKMVGDLRTTMLNKEYMQMMAYFWSALDYRHMAMETCTKIGYNSGIMYCVKKGLRDTEKFLRQIFTLEQYLKTIDESVSSCISSLRSHLSMTEDVAQQQALSHFQTAVRVVLKSIGRTDIAGTIQLLAVLLNDHLSHNFRKKMKSREELLVKSSLFKKYSSDVDMDGPSTGATVKEEYEEEEEGEFEGEEEQSQPDGETKSGGILKALIEEFDAEQADSSANEPIVHHPYPPGPLTKHVGGTMDSTQRMYEDSVNSSQHQQHMHECSNQSLQEWGNNVPRQFPFNHTSFSGYFEHS